MCSFSSLLFLYRNVSPKLRLYSLCLVNVKIEYTEFLYIRLTSLCVYTLLVSWYKREHVVQNVLHTYRALKECNRSSARFHHVGSHQCNLFKIVSYNAGGENNYCIAYIYFCVHLVSSGLI